MGDGLYGQPGPLWQAQDWREKARGEVVEPHAVLEIADGVLNLGVAAVVGLQIQRVAISVGDEGVRAAVGEECQLGATLCPCPGRAEVTNW